ncbi:Adenosylhomocysteinase [Citrus sinensis]|nr:Adenosylhomocysteinase [Citrus sinensis]
MQSRVPHDWPLKGTKITGTLHTTVQTAVLIETLTALGAEVLGQHLLHARPRGFGHCRALDWGNECEPDLVVDDGGDATLLIHLGRLLLLANGTLFSPAANINDNVTKSKFDNLYGCRHSLPDGIMRATDVMIAGKIKGCATALKCAGARVVVTEADAICDLQALNGGNPCPNHRRRPLLNIQGLESYPGIKRITVKPQTDRWVFPETNAGVIVPAEGHPSFVISMSFTNQVINLMELRGQKDSRKYDKKVYVLPKHFDKMEAEYIHVPVEGPYKLLPYRY